jgi:hypothetical protein
MNTNISKPKPFANDVDYLEAEGGFILARAARLTAERKLVEDRHDSRRDTIGIKASAASKEGERRITILRETEDRLRADLDGRLSATHAAGPTLGLDALTAEFELGPVERTTLLFGTLAALDEKFEEAIRDIGSHSYGSQLCPELVFAYLELDFAGRVEARPVYFPASPLLKHGLIALTTGNSATPYDLRSAYVTITPKAFNTVIGIAADDGGDE